MKTYRVVLTNPDLFMEYRTTSFARALELFVEEGGNIEKDLRHVEELPERMTRGANWPTDEEECRF